MPYIAHSTATCHVNALRYTQRSTEQSQSEARCGRGILPHHPTSANLLACCDHDKGHALRCFPSAGLASLPAMLRAHISTTCTEPKHFGARNATRLPIITFDSPASGTIRWFGKAAESLCKGCVRCRLMGGFECYLEASPDSPGRPGGLRAGR